MRNASSLRVSSPSTLVGQAPAKPVKTISVEHLNKATRLSKEDRAEIGALWLCGKIVIKPTQALAALVLHISISLIRRRLAEHAKLDGNGASSSDSNGNGTTVLSRDEIKNMIIETGPDLFWDVFTELRSRSCRCRRRNNGRRRSAGRLPSPGGHRRGGAYPARRAQ